MSTINTQFRNFKEPTKDQLLRNFFSIPPSVGPSAPPKDGEPTIVEKAEMTVVRPVNIQRITEGTASRSSFYPIVKRILMQVTHHFSRKAVLIIYLVRKTLSATAVFGLHLPRQEVCPIYATSMCN